jgi:hypothetical protein
MGIVRFVVLCIVAVVAAALGGVGFVKPDSVSSVVSYFGDRPDSGATPGTVPAAAQDTQELPRSGVRPLSDSEFCQHPTREPNFLWYPGIRVTQERAHDQTFPNDGEPHKGKYWDVLYDDSLGRPTGCLVIKTDDGKQFRLMKVKKLKTDHGPMWRVYADTKLKSGVTVRIYFRKAVQADI